MRVGLCFLLVALGLGGCGYMSPPRGYEPADSTCGSLAGHWMVTETDLPRIAPHLEASAGKGFPFLRIEEDVGGQVVLVFSRPRADVLAEAATLRLKAADDYRYWRSRALGEPLDSELLQYTPRTVGPVAIRSWRLSLADCDDGWRASRAGYDRVGWIDGERVDELVFPSLAIGPGGELLVEHRVRRKKDSGFVFFGQSVTYFTYSHSTWHRLAPIAAAAVPPPLSAADLPPLPNRLERLEFEMGRERRWASFSGWVRDHVPAGVTITILREPTWDPVAAALPLDRMRVELAGHWPDVSPDPFTPVVSRNPRVTGPIEVKESRPHPGNRRYLRLEFTIEVEPVDL